MKPLIVANWKMNTTLTDALILANGVKEGLADIANIDTILCPPFPWLVPVAEVLANHRLHHLFLGAQDVFWKDAGPYTGEVSAAMLRGLATYVIVGHSERRHYFQETDREINQKIKAVLQAGLRPILCVGEVKRPGAAVLRNPSDLTRNQLGNLFEQLDEGLSGIDRDQVKELVIAYEPVWAISSSKQATAATGHYANQVIGLIKRRLAHHFGEEAVSVPVLYGGSVDSVNTKEFISQEAIDGLLVGNASLKIKSFISICEMTR